MKLGQVTQKVTHFERYESKDFNLKNDKNFVSLFLDYEYIVKYKS